MDAPVVVVPANQTRIAWVVCAFLTVYPIVLARPVEVMAVEGSVANAPTDVNASRATASASRSVPVGTTSASTIQPAMRQLSPALRIAAPSVETEHAVPVKPSTIVLKIAVARVTVNVASARNAREGNATHMVLA